MRCFDVNREMCIHKVAKCGRRLMRKKTKRRPPAATAYACGISIDLMGNTEEVRRQLVNSADRGGLMRRKREYEPDTRRLIETKVLERARVEKEGGHRGYRKRQSSMALMEKGT